MDSQNRSRTHWVHMRRAMLGEDPETLDERIDGHRFKAVGGRYLKWLQQNEQAINGFDKSQLPKHLIGRDRDKWLPLFAIASVAGNKWLDRIRRYALEELDDSNQLTDSTQILKAVQDIYFNWDRYSVKPRDTKVTTGDLSSCWRNGLMKMDASPTPNGTMVLILRIGSSGQSNLLDSLGHSSMPEANHCPLKVIVQCSMGIEPVAIFGQT